MGLGVYSNENAGKEAGEIVGYPAVGITAIQNADELLKNEADCVMYHALGMTLGDIEAPLTHFTLIGLSIGLIS